MVDTKKFFNRLGWRSYQLIQCISLPRQVGMRTVIFLSVVWIIALFILSNYFLLWTVNVRRHAVSRKATIHCRFPDLNPFDPQILSFINNNPTIDCKKAIPKLVDVVNNKLLKVDHLKIKVRLESGKVDACKYRSITMRPEDDFAIDFSEWSQNFTNFMPIRKSEDILHVDCFYKNYTVSRSYHALVRKKPAIEKQRIEDYKKHVAKNSPKETLSVLFIGVDGMSRMNFIRTMTKTRLFLLEKFKAIEFKQFNKVGLNTFPNILPLQSGMPEEELKGWDYNTPFDQIDHHFLWHHYQKAGYRTAMMFDNGWITAFHYLKRGWLKPAFDYYPRPIVLASEDDTFYRQSDRNCMGDTPEITHLLDYWVQLTTLYNNTPSTPYFAYSFLTRLSHDYQDMATAGDELYLQFFQELHRRRVMNNTLLVFFSDHGARFGDFRHTYNGVYEARAPMLYFSFPPWFESKYPRVMANFRINIDRLVTVYDIHETMKELLMFTGKPKKASPLARGISLFSEIPTNRTCRVAGIPLKFCGCTAISRANNTSAAVSPHLVKRLLEYVVGKTDSVRDKCEILEYKETLSVLEMTPETEFDEKNQTLYHVTIRTTPGDALYESSMLFTAGSNKTDVIGEVSRLTMYRGQAECMDSVDLRSFCYCKKKPK